jgi:2-succinyl-5-enolpyruvyl-6-hydroxy-3-cyclohexene-1-carboxylate synthase
MLPADLTAAFAATLVDEWVRAGVTDAVVAPGSRSAPLALALSRDERMRVHVVIDERSAAFFALGLGRATGRPALVCCTSGTAGAHFHPAVIEADLAGVPLLVCTANRPPELLDIGAGQTIDQHHLFGGSVRWFVAPGPPEEIPGAGAVWRSTAARAVAAALGPPAGPVHLDLAFREPLVPAAAEPIAAPGRPDGAPWTVSAPAQRRLAPAAVATLADRLHGVERGLIVAGWGSGSTPKSVAALANTLGWPLFADPISNLRTGPHAISTYDALLRVERFAARHRPDLVLRLGAPLTSKVATAFFDPSVDQIVIDPDGRWLDPHRAARERMAVDTEPLLRDLVDRLGRAAQATSSVASTARESPWLADWRAAELAARGAIDALLDHDDTPFDARIARDVYAAVPDGGTLLVASSMPVREVEWFAAPRSDVTVHANRGANGIDGLVSTTLGIAAGGRVPTVGLLGDLAWLHDTNGLLAVPAFSTKGFSASGSWDNVSVTFVVLDNGGGGIFHFLPVSEVSELDALFVTPQAVDPVATARAHGIAARRVDRASEVGPALGKALDAGGVSVIVVPTDRHANVERHERLWAAVAGTVA